MGSSSRSSNDEAFKQFYKSVMNEDVGWNQVEKLYSKIPWDSALPTVSRDTALHIAIYMGREEIAEKILKHWIKYKKFDLLKKENDLGDTVLHEAAAAGMTTLARQMLDLPLHGQLLLSKGNNLGERPLFKAALCGREDMFELLAEAVDNMTDSETIFPYLSRKDSCNILHATIRAEFFDLAYMIAKRYPQLMSEEERYTGMIGLQILSCNRAAFKSGTNYGLLSTLIYNCILSEKYLDDNQEDADDHELGFIGRARTKIHTWISELLIQKSTKNSVPAPSQNSLASRWPMIKKIYKEKKRHESAFRLAKLLIKEDISWELSMKTKEDNPEINISTAVNIPIHEDSEEDTGDNTNGKQYMMFFEADEDNEDDDQSNTSSTKTGNEEGSTTSTSVDGETTFPRFRPPTSLLIATSRGIVEIVKEILRVYPQAVEHVSDKGQNILHVAIKYRQKEIFSYVRRMNIPSTSRLVSKIDKFNFSILHQVGVMKYYTGGTRPGPALQLEEELSWLKWVKSMLPPNYKFHGRPYKDKRETAEEFFGRTHRDLHKEAQEWLKRTSESCSTVAVLIATVAFAAAYTVPGGSSQKTGIPILLDNPFFLAFTVMDVLSLASSLTSVVMFLSILTSPLELHDFYRVLPRRLIMAFTFLFFSVTVMMLTFAVTIILVIRQKNRWITSIIYTVAFLPVSVFALLQLPVYLAFLETMRSTINVIKRMLPWNAIPWLKATFKLCSYKAD